MSGAGAAEHDAFVLVREVDDELLGFGGGVVAFLGFLKGLDWGCEDGFGEIADSLDLFLLWKFVFSDLVVMLGDLHPVISKTRQRIELMSVLR